MFLWTFNTNHHVQFGFSTLYFVQSSFLLTFSLLGYGTNILMVDNFEEKENQEGLGT